MRMNKPFVAVLVAGSVTVVFIFLTSIGSIYRSPSPGIPGKIKVKRVSPSGRKFPMRDPLQEDMRERVRLLEGVCRQLKANGSDFHEIQASELDHIVVDDRYKVMYCYVPKVACTNLKRIFLMLSGQVNVTDPLELKSAAVHDVYDEYLTYLDTYTPDEIRERLQKYKKVIFVREPFERILSAFRNKFLQKGNSYFKERFGRKIVKLYRENPDVESMISGADIKFDEFVQYLIDPRTQKYGYNEHWKPFFQLCHPCHVHYNYIGKYDTLDRDVDGLLKLLHVDDWIRFPDRGDLYKTSKTAELLGEFYKDIDRSKLNELMHVFQEDANVFGYNFTQILKNIF